MTSALNLHIELTGHHPYLRALPVAMRMPYVTELPGRAITPADLERGIAARPEDWVLISGPYYLERGFYIGRIKGVGIAGVERDMQDALAVLWDLKGLPIHRRGRRPAVPVSLVRQANGWWIYRAADGVLYGTDPTRLDLSAGQTGQLQPRRKAA